MRIAVPCKPISRPLLSTMQPLNVNEEITPANSQGSIRHVSENIKYEAFNQERKNRNKAKDFSYNPRKACTKGKIYFYTGAERSKTSSRNVIYKHTEQVPATKRAPGRFMGNSTSYLIFQF